jgi:hypothetical protein
MIDEVRARRAEFEANRSRPWPDIIRDGHEIYAEAAVPAEAADGELCGVAGSTGVVTGVARVIRGPKEVGKLRNNDILVAPLTNPVWTPSVRRRWRGDHRGRRHPVPRGHRGPGIRHPGGPVGCRRDKTRARRTEDRRGREQGDRVVGDRRGHVLIALVVVGYLLGSVPSPGSSPGWSPARIWGSWAVATWA